MSKFSVSDALIEIVLRSCDYAIEMNDDVFGEVIP
jgi:hypothetical protein